MIKWILFLLLILFVSSYSNSQNLLQNSSFELVEQGHENHPDFWHDAHYMQNWENNQTPVGGNCGFNYSHSPDWFGPNWPLFEFVLDVNNIEIQQEIPAQDGDYFIGMTYGELVTQEVPALSENTIYTITFYVRTVTTLTHDSETLISTPSSSVPLKVWLSKDHISYKHHQAWDCSNSPCDIHYDDFSDGILQNINEIANFPINMVDFPYTKWTKVQSTFTVPESNGNPYKWISLELQQNYDDCSYYVLIDNVSIECGCKTECSHTNGCISPVFAGTAVGSQNGTCYFNITNLNNVKNAVLEITSETNNQTTTEYSYSISCENGISGSLVWTGINSNNVPLATAWYNYKLITNNDCSGIQTFQGDVLVAGVYDFANNPIASYTCNASNIQVPDPCCESIYDYNLDNASIGGPEHLEWKIRHDLIVGQNSQVNINNNGNVLFQAGHAISADNLITQSGSVVDFHIQECANQRLSQFSNIVLSNFSKSLDIQDTASPKQNLLNFSFSNSPNPSSQRTIFKYSIFEKSEITILVSNLLGQTIATPIKNQMTIEGNYETSFDVSILEPGVYFSTFIAKPSSPLINSISKTQKEKLEQEFRVTKKIVVINN